MAKTPEKWFYTHNNKQHGPCTSAELKQLAQSGLLLRTDLVWKEGLAEWAAAEKLRGLFPPGPPPVPPVPSGTMAAPAQGSHSGMPTGFPIDLSGSRGPSPNPPSRVIQDAPKGFAITGLVLGVCGLVVSVTPCVSLIGIVPDVLGIIFGSIALARIKHGKGAGKGMAVSGLVCGFVGIWLWVGYLVLANKAVSDIDRNLEKANRQLEKSMDMLERAQRMSR